MSTPSKRSTKPTKETKETAADWRHGLKFGAHVVSIDSGKSGYTVRYYEIAGDLTVSKTGVSYYPAVSRLPESFETETENLPMPEIDSMLSPEQWLRLAAAGFPSTLPAFLEALSSPAGTRASESPQPDADDSHPRGFVTVQLPEVVFAEGVRVNWSDNLEDGVYQWDANRWGEQEELCVSICPTCSGYVHLANIPATFCPHCAAPMPKEHNKIPFTRH